MVGELHVSHPLEQTIKKNGLSEITAMTGHVGLDKFYTYILAADLVVNLRYPSAGETSATLMRALGMGRAAVIFDYGPFRDYPPSVAVKLPLDTQHSEALGAAILDLYRHPEKRLQLERSAQTFIRREHDLSRCVAQLAEFTLECHQHRSQRVPLQDTATLVPSKRLNIERCRDLVRIEHEHLELPNDDSVYLRGYLAHHLERFAFTLSAVPSAAAHAKALELGSYLVPTVLLKTVFGYEVTAADYDPSRAGALGKKKIVTASGSYEFPMFNFNVETDQFPFPDRSFDLVLCCEIIQHLFVDPVFMLKEVNRVLKYDGVLILTTPNIASAAALHKVLAGSCPMSFYQYRRNGTPNRHNIEYSKHELYEVVAAAGFDPYLVMTHNCYSEYPVGILELLRQHGYGMDFRGDNLLVASRKVTESIERYPKILYENSGPQVFERVSQQVRAREAISHDPKVLAPAEDRDASPPLNAKVQMAAQAKAELSDFLASGTRLAFFDHESPQITVLIVLWNQAHMTLRCLRALDKECKTADSPLLEIVLVDNASSDETGELLSRLDGARIIRNTENVGFVHACSQAAAVARGPSLLFLNNDACVRPGALSAAHATLNRASNVGAVGARLIMPSGLIQEAGCIVWSDGSTVGYGRGLAADEGEVMFRRDVDYCSAAFLLTPRLLWEKLGGFDESYAPAYYEDVDYCMRVREAGLRVVYEPAAAVDHYEYGSSNSDEARATMLINRKRFRARYAKVLHRSFLPAGTANILAARERRVPGRRRLLVIDDEVPLRGLVGAYPRMREMLVESAAAGWLVSFYPLQKPKVDWTAARADLPCEIEILSAHGAENLGTFLEKRCGYYDLILVSRPDNMARVCSALRERPYLIGGTRLIYDAQTLFAARTIAQAALEGHPLPIEEADRIVDDEIGLAAGADAIICVTEMEAKAFRDRHLEPVYILSHSTQPRFDAPGFEGRHGFLFVRHFLEQHAPNGRGLEWFIREVWPLIRSKLPDATMIVTGHLYPDFSELEALGVRVVGPATDLNPLYDAARVFVAPAHLASGVPVKILEAAAAGLPTAATSLVARQLGWAPGIEIAIEDEPVSLAVAAVTLHEDSSAWGAVRAAAQRRIAREYTPEAFRNRLRELLDVTPVDSQALG